MHTSTHASRFQLNPTCHVLVRRSRLFPSSETTFSAVTKKLRQQSTQKKKEATATKQGRGNYIWLSLHDFMLGPLWGKLQEIGDKCHVGPTKKNHRLHSSFLLACFPPPLLWIKHIKSLIDDIICDESEIAITRIWLYFVKCHTCHDNHKLLYVSTMGINQFQPAIRTVSILKLLHSLVSDISA